MGRFITAQRRVLREDLRPSVRFLALLWSIESYCWLTDRIPDHRASFHTTFAALGHRFGFDWQIRPDPRQMVAAICHLTAERERFLIEWQTYSMVRINEKRTGKRKPNKFAIERLYASAFPRIAA